MEPKTLEEFIGQFELPRQVELRQVISQVHNLMMSWPPETRGENIIVASAFLQRGIGAACGDKPFVPDSQRA
jgi:hypothetical protein